MGGYGSGRQGGKALAETSLRIDLAWMIRTGNLNPGTHGGGTLHWSCNGEASGHINYDYDMIDPDHSNMTLRFTVKRRGEAKGTDHVQHIRLSYTVPTYGGRRWWMHCPVNGKRVAKLYCPNGGDIFASRQAWRIGYRSQRQALRDRPFEALFRLQRKLGCNEGWESFIRRPKGMWHRTYKRHEQRYWQLDEICGTMMDAVASVLRLRDDEAGQNKFGA